MDFLTEFRTLLIFIKQSERKSFEFRDNFADKVCNFV